MHKLFDSGSHEPFASAESAEPTAPEPPAPLDVLRGQAMVFEALYRMREQMIAPPVENSGGEVVDLLRRAQMLLLEHPIAAQAAFAALIAEGRRFAATAEGNEWKAALASSELVRRGRRVWDAISLNMLEEDAHTIVPSAYLEALLTVVRSGDIEGLLRRLYEGK